MTGEPPFAAAVTVIVAAPLLYARPVPTLTAVPVGRSGTVVAVIEFVVVAADVPLAFVAVTLKV